MRVATITLCFIFHCCPFVFGLLREFPDTDFRKADSIAALYPKHSLVNIQVLSDKLTRSLSTEEEKFRAIYKWVCLNIEYDFPVHQMNQEKRKKLKDPEDIKAWNKKISTRVFKTLIDKQRTVCTGYAYLVKELAFHAGITCMVIDGYGRTAQANIRGTGIINHSWNAVQLHDKWYLCDPTWSSGAYDTQQSQYIMKFLDEYFLADPAVFIRNHYPIDEAWMLTEIKPTLHAFLNAPLIYTHAYTFKVEKFLPETFDITAVRGEKVSFQFRSNSSNPAKAVDMIIKGPGILKNFTPFFSQDEGLYIVQHVFKVKGIHAVHILLDGNHVVTYEVRVK